KTSQILRTAIVSGNESTAHPTAAGNNTATNAQSAQSASGTTGPNSETSKTDKPLQPTDFRKIPIVPLLATIWNAQASLFQERHRSSLYLGASKTSSPPAGLPSNPDHIAPAARRILSQALVNSQMRMIQYSTPLLA